MICAAMGLAKGSAREAEAIKALAGCRMLSISIPRGYGAGGVPRPVLRLLDYHTVQGTRRASGKVDADATVITRREYLLDARFGVILEGPWEVLEKAAGGLRDPVWGIWLGRKSCVPAAPVFRGLFEENGTAVRELIGDRKVDEFMRMADEDDFGQGTDSLNDQPVSFGDSSSSGSDSRRFGVRRVAVTPASTG
jgi:CRISPR system Cascade subunit CasD